MMTDVLLVAAGYLVGSLPFGYWLVLLVKHEDVRRRGSGNIGASNVWRTYGRTLGVPVALLDVAKGFVPALAGLELGGEWVGVLAGIAAMIGHARPIFLGFRAGGKMVATAGGVSFALMPLAAVCCLVIWVALFLLTRYASVASMLTAAGLPLLALAFDEPWPTIAFGIAACVGVIVLHRRNIRRLLNGTESRFRFSRAAGAG
jgi:glycerol-3-phosphate acyltransferase PlsY